MKKLLLFLLLFPSLCFAGPLSNYSPIPQNKDKLFKFDLDNEFQNIYGQLSVMVDNSSNQSIGGNKTFTGSVTVSSLTVTNLSAIRMLGGGLKILQMVVQSTSTQTSTTSTGYTGTKVTANITPLYSTSKIFVIASGGLFNGNIANSNACATIYRGAVDISGQGTSLPAGIVSGSFAGNANATICMTALDSPTSTSMLTYAVNICNPQGYTTAFPAGSTGTIMLFEIGE